MFGSHALTQPEPDDTSAPSGTDNRRWAIIGLVLAVIVGGGWSVFQFFGDDTDTVVCTKANSTTVSLITAPAMADLVDLAVASLQDNGQCIDVTVSTASVAEVAAAQDEVGEGEEDVLPDLWIPDSPAWQIVLSDAGFTGRVVVPALATSPVGLASGSRRKAPASWLDTLKSPQLVKKDPRESGASALTMVAPYSEVAAGIGDASAAQGAIVPVAQRFGAKVAAGQVKPVTIDTIPSGSKRLLPVSEQDFLIARRGNEALTWIAPRTGVAVLNFPIVQPDAGDGGIGVGTGSLDVAGRTGERIAAWFTTDAGIAAIADEQLRGPDGAPLPDDESVSTEKQLPAASRNQIQATMESWFTLTVPSSILAVIETSDAMTQSAGSTTRLNVATGAALTALDALPDHARIGMWSFSTNQGGNGQDWREVAPFRRLDAPTGSGQTQADVLRAQANVLPGLAGGGTGLYDTVLAAYQLATREYNPAYANSVAVMTIGVNNDPGSITLEQLVRELEAMHDPERPVRIIPIGIGSDADMSALQQIASATGAQAYEAVNPEDVLIVLASGLLSR
jgi:von Willebrand factor type A domain